VRARTPAGPGDPSGCHGSLCDLGQQPTAHKFGRSGYITRKGAILPQRRNALPYRAVRSRSPPPKVVCDRRAAAPPSESAEPLGLMRKILFGTPRNGIPFHENPPL
jgi:hypothetical protein